MFFTVGYPADGGAVGSGAGARTVGSGGSSIAFALGLRPAPMATSPAPASSNGACGFPALRFPDDFTPGVMGPLGQQRFRDRRPVPTPPGPVEVGLRPGKDPLPQASWSPCCRSHPAGGTRRVGQLATGPAAFALGLRARPPGLRTFGATSAFTRVTARGLADHPEDDRVDGLQDIRFPSCLPSKLRGFGSSPGGTDSR